MSKVLQRFQTSMPFYHTDSFGQKSKEPVGYLEIWYVGTKGSGAETDGIFYHECNVTDIVNAFGEELKNEIDAFVSFVWEKKQLAMQEEKEVAHV